MTGAAPGQFQGLPAAASRSRCRGSGSPGSAVDVWGAKPSSSLYVVARPYCVELARMPGSTVWWPPVPDAPFEHVDGVLVFAPSAPINFTNCERICAEMRSAIARQRLPVKVLVIEANGIIDIDYTGSQVLRRAIADLKSTGIVVALARMSAGRVQEQARRTGLIDTIGPDRVFMSVEEAVRKLSSGGARRGANAA